MNREFIEAIYRDAELYDAEFQQRAHEIPLLMELAGGASPILEVACGTGRLALPLAQAGNDVTGLDICSTLILKAREKAGRTGTKIDFHVDDVRTFQHEIKYGLILFVANALQHLTDTGDALAALKNCRAHLQEGGLLLLEVMMPDAMKLSQPAGHRKLHKRIQPDSGSAVEVWRTIRYDPVLQVLYLQLDYLHDGLPVHRKDIQMRMFYPQELRALLKSAGLQVKTAWGGYDRTELMAGSHSQLLLCTACAE